MEDLYRVDRFSKSLVHLWNGFKIFPRPNKATHFFFYQIKLSLILSSTSLIFNVTVISFPKYILAEKMVNLKFFWWSSNISLDKSIIIQGLDKNYLNIKLLFFNNCLKIELLQTTSFSRVNAYELLMRNHLKTFLKRWIIMLSSANFFFFSSALYCSKYCSKNKKHNII